MPKFIVDECTGMAVVHFLREQGHDAVGVIEVMLQADDFDILQYAVAEARIVISNGSLRYSGVKAALVSIRLPTTAAYSTAATPQLLVEPQE